MKKLAMLIAAFAFSVPAPLALPTAAQAAPNPWVGFCKDYVATGADANLNLGECISLVTTESHYYDKGNSQQGFATHACDYIMENLPDDFSASYDSFDECVRDGA